MNAPQIYVLIMIVALAVIAVVTFFVRKDKKGKPLTPLAGISMILVLAGVFFPKMVLSAIP